MGISIAYPSQKYGTLITKSKGVTLNLRTKKLNRDHCRSGSTQIKQTKKQSARVFKIIKKELLDGFFDPYAYLENIY